jgi:hypothetical protein
MNIWISMFGGGFVACIVLVLCLMNASDTTRSTLEVCMLLAAIIAVVGFIGMRVTYWISGRQQSARNPPCEEPPGGDTS